MLVIFGASGDLTSRKLMPALYALAFRHLLPDHFAIVGAARSEESDDEFRERMKKAVQEHARDEFRQDVWDELAAGMRYVTLDTVDDAGEDNLTRVLREVDHERGTHRNRVYYFAVPPTAIEALLREIAGRRSDEGWVRLIIEKPFGTDVQSARKLNEVISENFAEEQIFRIDHYLGSAEHAGASVLERHLRTDLNRQFIDPQIIAEFGSRGCHLRACRRDARHLQNHLLQLVAISDGTADFTADSLRNEIEGAQVDARRPVSLCVAVRAVHRRGRGARYREKTGSPRRPSQTYAAKLRRQLALGHVLRARGSLPRRDTSRFSSSAPHPPFENRPPKVAPNVLQRSFGQRGMLAIGAKVPDGNSDRTKYGFLYGSAPRGCRRHERLILDAMLGERPSSRVRMKWKAVGAGRCDQGGMAT